MTQPGATPTEPQVRGTDSNEAAERLREMFEGFIEPDEMHRDLDAALNWERRRTAERIRDEAENGDPDRIVPRFYRAVANILNSEHP